MPAIAPILEQTVNKIRFSVDQVKPAPKKLPITNAKLLCEKYFEKPLLAFSHSDDFSLVPTQAVHPFVQAVHISFSQHRPLIITPDIVWITLAQGFAQHVNNNAEALRSRFVSHQGKKKLVIETDSLSPESWSKMVFQWALKIGDHVGAELCNLLECNFTTTTLITRTVSYAVIMDTFQKYFDYEAQFICGITDITFEGTVEDWQSIYDRIQYIAQYDLGWWTDRVLPICAEFVATAAGKPSLEFWQSIYIPQKVYGGELITGWLADLFPYLTNTASVPNPILNCDRINFIAQPGISPDSIPLGLSQVPIVLNTSTGESSLALMAGFIGVHQTEAGQLRPEIGWAVIKGVSLTASLDKIQQEHITNPPINWQEFDVEFDHIPKDIVQMLSRFDGAILYADTDHPWKLDRYDPSKTYQVEAGGFWPYKGCVTHFIQLGNKKDRRCLAYFGNWIVLGKVDYGKLENPVLIADSLPNLFEKIFQAEGAYYFDSPKFVPIYIDLDGDRKSS